MGQNGTRPRVGAVRAKSLLWGASLGTESSRISSLKRQCIALAGDGCCRYNNLAPSTFDPVKREKALADRGLDFADAALVFEGVTLEVLARIHARRSPSKSRRAA